MASSSSSSPAADGRKLLPSDETPSGIKHRSSDETLAAELEGARPPAEKIPAKKAAAEPPVGEPLTKKNISSGAPLARRMKLQSFLGVADLDGGAVLFAALVSLLYALVTPWLLRRVADKLTDFVLTISALACSYFFIGAGAIRFSVTMRFVAIFCQISCGAMLLMAATYFISSNSGAAVATLLTYYAAGIFDDQQQPSECKEDQKQPSADCKEDQGQLDEPMIQFLFVHGVLSLFTLIRMVWVVLCPGSVMFIVAYDEHAKEALLMVEELSFETLFLIWPWGCFMALILQEGTVVSRNTMVSRVPISVVALFTLGVVLSVAFDEAYGLLVLWVTPIPMAGLFGYILSMFARYNHSRASLSQDQQPLESRRLRR
ncbi:hypothetical protein BS78_03G270600 [Paspalum vaginatum]|nr:hypothetical protein BS78_03G270600 [Paspalum vaginatum]